jgi:hypothetical protein
MFIHNCSNEFLGKFSKPKMSNNPIIKLFSALKRQKKYSVIQSNRKITVKLCLKIMDVYSKIKVPLNTTVSEGNRCGHHLMVVGFTTSCAISTSHH